MRFIVEIFKNSSLSFFKSLRFSLCKIISQNVKKLSIVSLCLFLSLTAFSQSSWLDSLYAEKNNHDTIVMEAINSKGRSLISASPDSALFYFREAVNYAESSKSEDDRVINRKASALRFIGIVNRQIGNSDIAIDYYDKALGYFRKIDNMTAVALCYRNIGNVYFYESDYYLAREYYNKALAIFDKQEDYEGKASIYNNLGNIYENQGDYDSALENYYKILNISEEMGNKNLQSAAHTNIAVIHYRHKDYDRSIEHFEKSFALKEEIDDVRGMALLLMNMSSVYFGQSEIEECSVKKNKLIKKAIESLQESIEIRKKLNDPYGLSLCYNSLGQIYNKIGNIPLALDYLNRSLEISKSINNKRGKVFVYRNFAEVYYKQKEYNKSIFNALRGLELAEEMESLADQKAILFYLMKAYSAIGESEIISKYLDQYSVVSDSLFSISRAESVAEMETRYQTEKKEKEIELLNRDKELQNLKINKTRRERNTFIVSVIILSVFVLLLYKLYNNRKKVALITKEKNKELENSNKTKDKFISILAHDLKSPFASFLNIARALNNDFDKIDNDDKRKFIQKINKSAEEINKLLNNILQWAVVKRGSSKPETYQVNIYDVAEESVNSLKCFIEENNVEIDNNISKDIVAIANKGYLAVIINNLITNAVKFSSDSKLVKIYSKVEKDFAVITVEDYGIGMDIEDTNKLFRIDVDTVKIGNSGQKGTGMGLLLCKELIENMKGKIWVESEKNIGSKFSFSIPVVK